MTSSSRRVLGVYTGVDALGRSIVCVVAKNYSSSAITHERTLLFLINQLDTIVNKVR